MKKLHFNFLFLVFVLGNISLYSQAGWVQQTNPLGTGDSSRLGKIQFVSPTVGWISVSRGARLLHTTNSGSNWSVVSMSTNDSVISMGDPSLNLCFINPTLGWVIKSFGNDLSNVRGAVIYKTTNGGNSWLRNVISQNAGDLGLQAYFLDPNNGWVSIANLNTNLISIYKTTNGGNNWNLIFNGSFRIFSFIDVNNAWAINISQSPSPPFQILRTTDGGANWAIQFSDTTQGSFNAINFIDNNNGWVVGTRGKILCTSNGGVNWIPITTAEVDSLSDLRTIFLLNPNTGWIGVTRDNTNAQILFTNTGGVSWTTYNILFGSSNLSNIFFWDLNHGWFTMPNGQIGYFDGTMRVEEEDNIPMELCLFPNYPNPFNPTTKIEYQLAELSFVTLKVFDVLGKEVATLVNEEKPAGMYEVEFTIEGLPSGIYFYQLQASNFVETKKMVLMR
jgi:photosystem II stability/assembly factor-like uncharacterized protein